MKVTTLTKLCVLLLTAASCVHADSPWNVILILTDDQSVETVNDMPGLLEKIADRGVLFENAIVTNPACAPSRATLLSGGFTSRHTGVKSNSQLNGGVSRFDETRTLATALSGVGYATGFVGKYLHGYVPGHVPPGWTRFVGNEKGGAIQDYWSISNVTYGQNVGGTPSSEIRYGATPKRQYMTEFQTDEALRLMEEFRDRPFFLLLSYYAPHPRFIAESEEDLAFGKSIEQPCVDEGEPDDKPLWIQLTARSMKPKAIADCGQRSRSLQAALLQPVDRGVDRIFRAVERLGIADRTVIFFMADNGIVVGKRYLFKDKGMPHEGSIRVPLVAFSPGNEARVIPRLVAADLDVPATIIDLAGAELATQGTSLWPAVSGGAPLPERSFLIENYGYLNWRNSEQLPLPPMIWSGIRSARWKYVEYVTGEAEAYDLQRDPGETVNVASAPEYRDTLDPLREMLQARRGLAITSTDLPKAVVGEPYAFALGSWGGTPPFRWSLVGGRLPEGMELDTTLGTLQGVPKKSGRHRVTVRVSGQGTELHGGREETFARVMELCVSGEAFDCD
jgi:arylsulfatase A-like enzyme